MKKIKITLLAALFVVALVSCSEEKVYEPTTYKEVTLTLNDGAKWKVPASMKIYMDSTFARIDQLEKDADLTNEIKKELIRHKSGFVENCSMEGKGHDELHAWLIPYFDILEMVSTAKTDDEIGQAKAELIYAKELFGNYFE
jgi:hypothetical protein